MTEPAFRATVLTIYPDIFPGPLGTALSGKGLEKGLWSLKVVDIRDYARDKHRAVDDAPFGGGAGMVMRATARRLEAPPAAARDAMGSESDGRGSGGKPSRRSLTFFSKASGDSLARSSRM